MRVAFTAAVVLLMLAVVVIAFLLLRNAVSALRLKRANDRLAKADDPLMYLPDDERQQHVRELARRDLAARDEAYYKSLAYPKHHN